MAGNKDNMRQAIKELLGLSNAQPEEAASSAAPAQEDGGMLDEKLYGAPEPPQTAAPEKPPVRPAAAERPPVRPAADEPPVRPAADDSLFFGGGFDTVQIPGDPFREEGSSSSGSTFIRPGATVIAVGVSIFGDIRAEGDVEILGKLKGNLEATGNVRILGKVLGDIKGDSVALLGCAVQGNITASASVTMDETAVLVGDLLANDLESNGKIKGNLQIARAAVFRTKAVLAGNVSAATISMSQGTRIQGSMRIDEDADTGSLFGSGLEI